MCCIPPQLPAYRTQVSCLLAQTLESSRIFAEKVRKPSEGWQSKLSCGTFHTGLRISARRFNVPIWSGPAPVVPLLKVSSFSHCAHRLGARLTMDDPTSSLLVASVIGELEACRNKLTKKATFETSLQDIARLIGEKTAQFALPEVEIKLLDVSARSVTLLKTRYTSPAFWRAVASMLATAQVPCLSTSSVRGDSVFTLKPSLVTGCDNF